MPHERRIFVQLTDSVEASVKSGTATTEITISEEDSRHLIKVLRLEPGQAIVAVSKSSGLEFSATLTNREIPCTLKLHSLLTGATTSVITKSLIFALGRNPVNDLVCEKVTELGAEQIIFWQAQRSITEIEESQVPARLNRWRKIAESAAKQCGRNKIPTIELALSIEALLALMPNPLNSQDKFYLCSLSSEATPVRKLTPPPTSAHLLIGPAGDITEGEQDSLKSFGFELVSLGTSRLRSETAAIAAVALIEGVWGNR